MGTCFGLLLTTEKLLSSGLDDVRGGKAEVAGSLRSLLSAVAMELAESCEDTSSGLRPFPDLLNLDIQLNDGRLRPPVGSPIAG